MVFRQQYLLSNLHNRNARLRSLLSSLLCSSCICTTVMQQSFHSVYDYSIKHAMLCSTNDRAVSFKARVYIVQKKHSYCVNHVHPLHHIGSMSLLSSIISHQNLYRLNYLFLPQIQACVCTLIVMTCIPTQIQ